MERRDRAPEASPGKAPGGPPGSAAEPEQEGGNAELWKRRTCSEASLLTEGVVRSASAVPFLVASVLLSRSDSLDTEHERRGGREPSLCGVWGDSW